MRMRLKCIVAGFACSLCFSAWADDRPDELFEPNFHAVERVVLGQSEDPPLSDEQLAKLRAGMPAPAVAGVVLWDEPRKEPPPLRSVSEPRGASNVTGTLTILPRLP